MSKTKIYLSGKVSGCDNARQMFDLAEMKVHGLFPDAEVVNPLDHSSADDEWIDCMARDLKLMKDCRIVFMMRGWQQSTGARIEYEVAKRTDKLILFE